MKKIFAVVVLAVATSSGRGEALRILPASDTSLMEKVPLNNLGRSWLAAGTLSNSQQSRALLRFDLSAVPAGASLRSATLTLRLVRQPPASVTGPFRLHRMLVAWGEGAQGEQGINIGAKAVAGETTWLASAQPTTWSAPGGNPGTDFRSEASAESVLAGETRITFISTPELLSDLAAWMATPVSNHGWMVAAAPGAPAGTARRFGSRETTDMEPELALEYEPPASNVRIASITLKAGEVHIGFEAAAGKLYALEFLREASATNWSLLSLHASKLFPTNFVGVDAIAPDPTRFYRLVEVSDID